MKRLIWIFWLLIAAPPCLAGDEKPVMQDVWKEVLHKASQGTNAIKNYGKPRTVAKGGKPEIIIKGDRMLIDGKLITMGGALEEWKKAIPGQPRCDTSPPKIQCQWDDLGIEVLTKSNADTSVIQADFYFNIQPRELWKYATELPDGTPVAPPKDTRPKKPFRGYFEIDGYGIDAKSEFWEIRAKSDPNRNLHCGIRDCGFPLGALNANDTLHFRLNKPTVYGNIYEITITGPFQSP